MSSFFSGNIKLSIFGQSHSEAIGMTLDGIPAGEKIDFDKLYAFLQRRSPGKNQYSTPRKEADMPVFLSGIMNGVTTGDPITAIIQNTNTRSQDYDTLKDIPRPGHADFTAMMKYGDDRDHRGGGHFSGRLTAPLCIAGGICLQILEKYGVDIISRIRSVGDIVDTSELLSSTAEKDFPVVDDTLGNKMIEHIECKRQQGDSLGGVVECKILGLPVGLGTPMFDGMENRISRIVFAIPAIKGIEFGDGFLSAKLTGSQNNDKYIIDNGVIKTSTNHCGGILGGITNGMPVVFSVGIKPTPSISMEQNSVNIKEMKEVIIKIPGRHDPCIVPRAVPAVEAAAAIAVYDAFVEME